SDQDAFAADLDLAMNAGDGHVLELADRVPGAAQKNIEGLVQSENLAFVRTGLCDEKVGHGRLSLSGARCGLQPFSMLIPTQFTGNWQRTARACAATPSAGAIRGYPFK